MNTVMAMICVCYAMLCIVTFVFAIQITKLQFEIDELKKDNKRSK